MVKIRSLAGIFKYYDFKKNSFMKVKVESSKSLLFFIPEYNFVVLNGKVISSEDCPIPFIIKQKE
jgi:hypothetical protein